MRTKRSCLSLVAWFLGGFWTFAEAGPDGRQLFIEHCAACHQMAGQSGIGLPLHTEKLADVSDDYLHKTIRLGRPGRIMPAFERISDAQVDAIVRFLRHQSGTQGQLFSDRRIAGDAARGELLYAQHCVRCHGTDGRGEGAGTGVTTSIERAFLVMPASISNAGFLAAASDEMIRRVIEVGRKSSGMPAFNGDKLAEQDIDDLVAFVRSFELRQPEVAVLDGEQRPTHIYESPYDFETTVDNVKMALTGINFRIFPDRYLEQGLIDEFSVDQRQVGVRFCNFNVLYGMLKIEPRLGVVLPCRITILEQDHGPVLLVVPNLRVISRWFNNEELVELWDQMEQSFLEAIDEALL